MVGMDDTRLDEMARQAMRSASDKFRSILEDAPIGVYQATAAGRLVYANGAFARMLGYADEEALIEASSAPLRAMYRSAEDLEAHLGCIHAEASNPTMELRLLRADGSFFWASVQTRCIRDESGKPLYHDGFVTDITEKKALQAEAMRAAQLASLGELAAGVAHEINNPLNAVINFAQLLEEDIPDQGEPADLLGRILRESNRIAVVVRNLLSFARVEAESFGPVSLAEVASDSLGLTQAQMEKEGIRIRVEGLDELPRVRGRAQELQQVCINLLNNARHALNERHVGPESGKELLIAGELAESESPAAVLRIRDNGAGIEPELLDQVLDPFFSTKPKGVGTGLGLSISRKIAESHGGDLAIRSEPGRFTEVAVTLPVWREESHGPDSGH